MGIPLPRIYKPSGYAKDGSEYRPYIQLRLHHHHLHSNPDPLLVTQHEADSLIFGIALTTHEAYFGDKVRWLYEHANLINWGGSEDLEKQVRQYVNNA